MRACERRVRSASTFAPASKATAARTRRRCALSLTPFEPPMQPDARGYFGTFGGRFVPEVLIAALDELNREVTAAFADDGFWSEYHNILRDFVGRPSPLYG